MPRGAAAGARGGAEFGSRLTRIGRLEDLAIRAGPDLVEDRLARARCRAAGTVRQRFRTVHFVEVGFVGTRTGGGRASGASALALPGEGGGRTAALLQRGRRQVGRL